MPQRRGGGGLDSRPTDTGPLGHLYIINLVIITEGVTGFTVIMLS